MDAPTLKNIQLDVDGCIYSDSKIFRIERINSFGNLETGIDKPVKFHFLSQKSFGQAKDILDKNQHTKKQTSQDKSKFDNIELQPSNNANFVSPMVAPETQTPVAIDPDQVEPTHVQ